jgi:hypothetical protein
MSYSVIPRKVDRPRCITFRFDSGIESLASRTSSASLQLRLRFAPLRMTAI